MNDKLIEEHGIKSARSQVIIDYAYFYAKEAHRMQKRKYTDEPYIVHPVAVAQLIAEIGKGVIMICAALLHDVVEDTDTTYEDLSAAGFGFPIVDLVKNLTDVSKLSDGNRAQRKEIDRKHTAEVCINAKTIKLADLIDNTKTIVQYDPNFAKIYMAEKKRLLEVLGDGDSTLFAIANKNVEDYYDEKMNRG